VVSGRASEIRSDVLVVGGGLAGMAAAVRLAGQGLSVRILETRKKLGGRATSFVDVRSGRTLDNCQHVVLGCCTNYRDLLARLGATEKLRWHREQYWIEEGGRTSVIRPGLLPAPAHFTGSMLGAAFLTTGEKAAIARACARLLRDQREGWRDRTFAQYLEACGQPERAVRRFWAPVVVSACNLDVHRVAASVAMHVFQEGFLASAAAADIGVPTVPLVDLYENAESIVASTGGAVELGCSVDAIDEDGATLSSGRRFEAGQVICAVPVERVNRIVVSDVRQRDTRFATLDAFTHSPILGVHLSFDRDVLEGRPHAVLVDRPTQWLFRKDEAGTQVHAVISAADEWVALAEEEIGRRVLTDIHACLPRSRDSALLEVRAVKERLATFAPVPGIDAMRPPVKGDSRLLLAGDYTNTGWPATMEGATRSGYAAAAVVLGQASSQVVVPPLRTARLSAILGLRNA
jgi:squalene-associated FAD-dependent desaturase